MSDLEFENLPPGLVAPPKPVDFVAAGRRAEALVREVRSAAERGLLNAPRVGRVVAELNLLMMSVGTEWNKVQGNPRLFRVREIRKRKHFVGPFGSIDDLKRFNELSQAYSAICDAFAEIEIVAETEGLRQ
jgi:hypothetical protein